MVQFFPSGSQIITPPFRTSIQTIRRPRHSQEAQNLTNRYHSQLLSAKKRYLSSLVHSNSSNPRNLWKTVNNLLHRGNSSLLPDSIPHSSIADSFASFFTNKVSSLRLSLQTLLPTSTQYDSSPLDDKNDSTLPTAASFNLFGHATEAEITNLIHTSQNKQFQPLYLKNAQTFSSQL